MKTEIWSEVIMIFLIKLHGMSSIKSNEKRKYINISHSSRKIGHRNTVKNENLNFQIENSILNNEF